MIYFASTAQKEERKTGRAGNLLRLKKRRLHKTITKHILKQRVRSRKGQAIKVNVCEHEMEVQPGTTLFQLRDKVKPDADILVLNGAPANTATPLSEGDSVAFIKRGEFLRASKGL